MKTTYATAFYIILLPTSSAQLRPRGLAATEPDSAWSDYSLEMSVATTTSMNFMEANDKEAKVRAQGLSAKAGKSTKEECLASEGPCADLCLEALAEKDCPTVADPPVSHQCLNDIAIGELCQGYGRCGTNSTLDNCGDDSIYRRIKCESGKSGKSGKASGNPGGNHIATCANVCLQALAHDSCPDTHSMETRQLNYLKKKGFGSLLQIW